MKEERRLRTFDLPQQELLSWLNRGEQLPSHCIIPTDLKGIPEGAVVHSVYYFPERLSFEVLVSHESYNVVPHGERVPREGKEVSMVMECFEIVTPELTKRITDLEREAEDSHKFILKLQRQLLG